jgi:serine protease Do
MKRLSVLLVFLFLLPFSPLARGGTPSVTIGAYPVPATEMREQIIAWLRGSGFLISRGTADAGSFTLECSRGREQLLVEIRPDSPLASFARVSELTGFADGGSVVNGLKASLDAYVLGLHREGKAALEKIPGPVRSLAKAVFCLSASVRGVTVGFSGFAIDRRGFIVTTAHDLDGTDEISVFLENGEKIAGKVIRRDPLADLTLIKVERSFSTAIPAMKGRRKLKMGEMIYSIVCPAQNHLQLRTGIIDEPPAVVNGQPLWQAHMEVTPGDSGGPVFDANGRLAGVVKGRFRGGRSRGFLIPTNTLKEFLGLGGR